MYRQHTKSDETIKNNRGVMMGPKPEQVGVPGLSNSFRINLNVKNFVLMNWPEKTESVDLVMSIYEVSSEGQPPQALCENFVVKGWSKTPQEEDLSNLDNLRVVFGDIYKVCTHRGEH